MKSISRELIFLLLLIFLGSTSNFLRAQPVIHDLQEGDLIFQNSECGDLCQAINQVTPAIYGQHFSHVALLFKEKDEWWVVEATGDQVQLNRLDDFIKRSKGPILVGRLNAPFHDLIPAALKIAKQQVGLPYDDEFLYDNGKYYCSELIYDAFKEANHGEDVFEMQPMTFKKPGEKEYFQNWVEYYQRKGMEIPEGELGCNPGGMGNSEKLEIYKFR